MKLLLLILSVMTFTVESKSKVSVSGDVPGGAGVMYACSYQKGDVRAGDTATLSLSGLKGITVQAVDIYLKSNKNAGAGVLTMRADGQEIYRKEGTYSDWFGAYNNAEFLPLGWSGELKLDEGTLQIMTVGVTNSLHIGKYEISYTVPSPYNVRLMTMGAEYAVLKETSGGAGVLLPWAEDYPGWSFEGWSGSEFWEMATPPQFYQPGTGFYPVDDCTLWAVYRYDPVQGTEYETDLHDGLFLYVNSETGMAMAGAPEGGRMGNGPTNPSNGNQHYIITFADSQTATITHAQSGTPVGCQGTQMAAKASLWNVYHEGEETLFYTVVSGRNYVLWLNVADTRTGEYYTGLMEGLLGGSPMRLLSASRPEQVVYSCHPEAQTIETVQPGNGTIQGERVIPFGLYELRVKDGKKYVRLR